MKILNFIAAPAMAVYFDNSIDALIPEIWAQESLAILEENMIAGQMVYRDFENEIASYGDVVNTRKPSEFKAERKTNADSVTVQDVISTNIAVTLDQHIHVSFMIKDGEESKSFKNLIEEYLHPAMLAQARMIDQIVLGQFPQFLQYTYGSLGGLSGTTAKEYILGIRNVMNKNKADQGGRSLIWTPDGETAALNTEIFLTADKVGDEGTALREASLGRKLGLNHFMCQNMSSYVDSDITSTGAINLAAGYVKGTTTLVVDGFSAAIANNSWIKIAGDNTPLRVVSTSGGATPVGITVASPGIRHAVVDNAVVTIYGGAAINLSGGYAAGYSKYLAIDTFTKSPRVGQMVSFGTDPTSVVYTIVAVDATRGIMLDRPLEATLADNAVVNLAPGGDYNLAFHKNAIALVTRPLAQPRAGTGALSGVVNYNGLSMRAVITYDGNKQGHLVTLDALCGIKVIEPLLGAVLFA